jgi:hypothetical protein
MARSVSGCLSTPLSLFPLPTTFPCLRCVVLALDPLRSPAFGVWIPHAL